MTAQTQTPVRKLVAFWTILVLIPLAALVLLEGALRLFNYAPEIPLVVRKAVAGRELYAINRDAGKRYFRAPGITVPEPSEDTFEIVKPANGKRIFCLGESTMAGFPYEFNATAPGLLRQRLQAMFPDRPIEVVNVGISAVGTYVVAELVDELLDYQPDLLILYDGHNEFYGAFGAASTVGIGGSPWLTRLYLTLSHYKTFVLVRNVVEDLTGLFSHPKAAQPGRTLMAEVIGEQAIPYGSPEYWTTIDAFETNLKGMIETCRSRGVPVVLSSLVSNIRDHAPFRSALQGDLDAQSRSRWDQVTAAGDSAMAQDNVAEAVRLYTMARAIDSSHAGTLYKLAKALRRAGRVSEAREMFLWAKDYDLLRFRASEDLVRRLRFVAQATGTPLVPVDSAFEAHSEDGLIGSELMLEHLHPNIRGYALMAETFAKTIQTHGLLFDAGQWLAAAPVSENEVVRRSAISRFDTLVGSIKVELLTHRWPFLEKPEPYMFQPKDAVEGIVYRYIQGRLAWSEARYELAEYYAGSGRFDEARRECQAVATVIPFSYHPYLRIADYYSRQGLKTEAARAYQRCYEVQDNPFARVKLAVILLEENRAQLSLSQLQSALALPRSGEQLTSAQLSLAYYLQAVAQAKLGNFVKARESARTALRYDPASAEAKDLLRQLDALQGIR
jgi:tetratricopeptide (TPR) repeat protein